jgi:glutamate synthase (NADPH/NADH) large chain
VGWGLDLGGRRRLDSPRSGRRPRAVLGEGQDRRLAGVLDERLLEEAKPAFERGAPVSIETRIRNRDRAFGAMLSGELARARGPEGLADDTITVRARGSAGQSFGAFAVNGITLVLEGDANDYVGKGLSGGILVVRPPAGAPFRPEEQVIVGNTVLYGATSGGLFAGRASGSVRNSGAVAVVEASAITAAST